ncbi:MAG: endoflagellar hook capping protein, partial [Leptospiraceae bacterium]|nr:endoflagellar hook capping protein [Leptospiraceae bacterium]
MPAPITDNQVRSDYLAQDRSVNLRQTLDEQQQSEESGLNGIEIRQTAKSLGKDDFLQILITQLTHQDPTSPVQDQQFIAQMAQFSSLEQMKNMSESMNRMATQQAEWQAQSLIGKFVVGKDFTTGEPVRGQVEAMFKDEGGNTFYKIGGRAVPTDQITLIANPDSLPVNQQPAPVPQTQSRSSSGSENNAPAEPINERLNETGAVNSSIGSTELLNEAPVTDAQNTTESMRPNTQSNNPDATATPIDGSGDSGEP